MISLGFGLTVRETPVWQQPNPSHKLPRRAVTCFRCVKHGGGDTPRQATPPGKRRDRRHRPANAGTGKTARQTPVEATPPEPLPRTRQGPARRHAQSSDPGARSKALLVQPVRCGRKPEGPGHFPDYRLPCGIQSTAQTCAPDAAHCRNRDHARIRHRHMPKATHHDGRRRRTRHGA